MKHVYKYVLTLILTILLVLGVTSMMGFAATAPYKDTADHWAATVIERWSDCGVLHGYAEKFRPGAPISRGEMAAVLQRVGGYAAAEENPFSDVSANKWYYSDVLNLAAVGIMVGYDGKAWPEGNITREEAAALMARVFDIEESAADSKPFGDGAKISPWAAGYVNGLHTAGYIKGKPGNVFDPKANITRAEVVTILDNMVKGFYNAPGKYSGAVNGNAVIRTDGVTLKDSKISQALYLMDGIGDGDVTLDHVTVAKTTYIRGGGPNSIRVTGGNLGIVEMNSLTNTHLVLSADTKAAKITLANTGTVSRNGITVTFDAVTGTLTLGGTVDKAVLNSDGSMTVTAGGIIYEIVPPQGKLRILSLSAGSTIKELQLKAPLQVTQTGQIDKITVGASGSVIDGGVKVKLADIFVDKGITITVNGKEYTGTGGALAAADGGATVRVSYETFGEPQIAPATVAKGSTHVAVPQPTRSQDAFTGWYTDTGCTEPFDAAQPLTKDITLYANWTERDHGYEEYSESDRFIDECSPRYAVAILSPTAPLTAANLDDSILIEGTGEIPAFGVTGGEGGRYEIVPQTDYEAGCLYTFSLKDADLTFVGENAAVRSLTLRPPKEETEVIDFNDHIIDVDWADVREYTADEETGIGAMNIPALKYSAVKERFLLNSADPEAKTTIRVKDFSCSPEDENYRETEYRNITALTETEDTLILETENSQLVDVFDDLEVFLSDIEIDLDDYMAGLDTQALAAQAAQSIGAQRMGDLLNAALAESPTLQGLLAETPTALGASSPAADYGFKTPSQENEKPLLPAMFNMFLELKNVKATTGETDNANMPYGSGYFVTVEFSYSGTINDKVQVDATFKVTEYMSLFAALDAKYHGVWNKPKSWDDMEVTFLSNIYSQTDITVDVIAKSVGEDPEYAYEIDITEELTKLINGDEETGEDASALLKKVLADQGDYLDLLELPLVKTSVEIIPGAPVVEVEFELDFIIKASFAAGIHADMTFLGGRALGFYYNLDSGDKINYNLPFERYDNQYYIDLWAAGYFGVKAGLKGEVSVGIIGLKDVFDAGMSVEFGVYADIWGLVHVQHYRHVYPNHKGTEVQGGQYFEVGVYLEMDVFVRSKTFSAQAAWQVLDAKWPVYSFGDRYLLIKFVNGGSRILTRGDLPLTGGAGLFDAEFIDLKTGETVKGGEYANPKNFDIVISSPYFEVDKTNWKIKIRTDKIGDQSVYPYIAPGTKTLSAAAIIYYEGSALAFGTHTVVPFGDEDLMYSQKGIDLVWADPGLDIGNIDELESYQATYYLEMDGKKTLLDQRDVLVGQIPGAPVLQQSADFLYFTWKDIMEYANNCVVKEVSADFDSAITKDTEYVIKGEKLQRLEAIVTHYGERWHFDVYAVNCGDLPKLPEGYDTEFGGWTAPVNWYVETGYPAITATALNQLQPASRKYKLGLTGDGRGEVTYRPDLAWVSGYPTTMPIYSYESETSEDYSGYGLFNNYSAHAYMHKWAKPPQTLAPGAALFASLWDQNYAGLSVNWTRFYEYLYVAEYAKKQCTVTFNPGDGAFAPYMEEDLDSYSMYTDTHLMGTTANVLPASAVVPPGDDPANTYTLTGWKDQNGRIYGLGTAYKITEDTIFTAVYTAVPDVYTITVYPIGAAFPDGDEKKTFSGSYGQSLTIDDDLPFNLFDDWKAAAGVGYEYAFDGWYSTGGGKLSAWPAAFGESGKKVRDTVIAAKIKYGTQRYTVSFHANGGKFPDGENTYTKVYAHESVIDPAEIPAPTRDPDRWYTYTFAGWALYDQLHPVTEAASYYAVWDMELFQDTPLPAGIHISDGERTEDINCVNIGAEYTPIEGYKYEPEGYYEYDPETERYVLRYIPTLTITGDGLTVSGAVLGDVVAKEDMVVLSIGDGVTDITFKDFTLTTPLPYAALLYVGDGAPLTVTISGSCRLEKYSDENSGAFSALYGYRDVLFAGSGENAALEIITENAQGFSIGGDLAFENLKLTMDVSGVIQRIDVNGDGTEIVPIMAAAFGGEGSGTLRFIDSDTEVRSAGSQIGDSIVIAGSGDFTYVSTDDFPAFTLGGNLTFEDFKATFHVSVAPEAGEPAVLAAAGINFTVGEPEDYGVIVKRHVFEINEGDFEYYYIFVDETGNPLADVTAERK